jgi:hypothetical protein
MKKYSGLDLLKNETPEETIKRLEFELQIEKQGRNNDMEFFENELKEMSKEFLLLCDNGYCKGDLSVGDMPCKYYDDIKGCMLKYRYE